MMNNKEILDIAMYQSAMDLSCKKKDFELEKNIVVISHSSDKARKYLELPFECNLVYYGKNIVASVSPELQYDVKRYIDSFLPYHCFETPNIHALDDILIKHGCLTCFMAEYYLPDMSKLVCQSCRYEMRLLEKGEFDDLYLPEWSNALCEKRKQLDMLCIGAYDGEKLVGLAGASADCEKMWQIGIDTLPEYRRCGIASALVSNLASEILKRKIVPFYCAAWANIASARNAIKSGFKPAWCELTAKKHEYVKIMNNSVLSENNK